MPSADRPDAHNGLPMAAGCLRRASCQAPVASCQLPFASCQLAIGGRRLQARRSAQIRADPRAHDPRARPSSRAPGSNHLNRPLMEARAQPTEWARAACLLILICSYLMDSIYCVRFWRETRSVAQQTNKHKQDEKSVNRLRIRAPRAHADWWAPDAISAGARAPARPPINCARPAGAHVRARARPPEILFGRARV